MPPPKKRLSVKKIKAAKKRLRLLQKERGYSLRQMAKVLGGKISFQSLGRFIAEKDFVPASDRVRELLDLYQDPNPYRSLPRYIKRTPEALAYVTKKREQIKRMYDDAKAQRTAWKQR